MAIKGQKPEPNLNVVADSVGAELRKMAGLPPNEFDVLAAAHGEANAGDELPYPDETDEHEPDVVDAEPAVQATALSLYTAKPEFSPDDVYVPRLRLVQASSRDVSDGTGKPGTWSMTGEEGKTEVEVIPMRFARRREYRETESFELLCSSTNMRDGVGNPGGKCDICPMNQWEVNDKGKRVPPACSFIYSYVVFVVGVGLAVLDFKRTNIQVAKSLNTLIAQRGLGGFAVKLGVMAQQKGRGNYYAATMKSIPVTAEMKEAAAASTHGILE